MRFNYFLKFIATVSICFLSFNKSSQACTYDFSSITSCAQDGYVFRAVKCNNLGQIRAGCYPPDFQQMQYLDLYYCIGVFGTYIPNPSSYCVENKLDSNKIAFIPNKTTNACGSIVQVDTQVLIEEIPVVGVKFPLVYSSFKVDGRLDMFKAKIPVTHPSSGTSQYITGKDVTINVSDRTYTQHYNYSNGIEHNFYWDGKDSSGQTVSSSVTAEVLIEEIFDSNINVAVMPVYPSSNKKNENPVLKPFLNQLSPAIYQESSEYRTTFPIGSMFAKDKGIGGWRFAIHHNYDLLRETLYKGDGTSLSTKSKLDAFGNYLIPSEDRTEVYVFDSNFKHVKTKHGLTGNTKYLFTYSSNRLVSIEDAFGNETTVQYSGNNPISITSPYGQVTVLSTDSNGYIDSVTNPASETFEMTYTSSGLLLTFEKPSGVVSTMSYDTDGKLISDTSSAGSSISLNSVISQTGQTITETTAEGIVKNHVLTSTPASFKRVTTYPYSLTREYVENLTNKTSYMIDSTGYKFYVDSNQSDPRFGSDFKIPSAFSVIDGAVYLAKYYSESATLSTSTDPFSIVTLTKNWTKNSKIHQSVYTGSSKTFVHTTPKGRTTTSVVNSNEDIISSQQGTLTPIVFSYDNHGRVDEISQGASRETSLTYHTDNGLLASVSNPLSQTTYYSYDDAGRLVSLTLPDSRVISYSYDSNGNLASVTPPGRAAHTMSYNGFDLINSYLPPTLSSPSTVASNYYYNDDKQLIQITRPDSQTIQMGYNTSTGLMTSMTLPTGNRSFTYTKGLLTQSISEDGFIKNIGYDNRQLGYESMSSYPSPLTYTIYYGTNSAHLQSVENLSIGGSSFNVAFTYDDDGLLKNVGSESISRSNSLQNISQVDLENITEDYSYSANYGELISIESKYNSTDLYKENFTRDDLGRISTRTEQYGSDPSDVYEYTYDSSGRLTTVVMNGSPVSSYQFDSNSNRISQTLDGVTKVGTYDAQDRMLTFGTKTFTYTSNGEIATMIDGGVTTSYTYDVMGSLKTFSNSSKTVEYKVDAHNRRVSRKVNTTMQNYFVWNMKNQLIAITDGSGTIQSRFVYGSKEHAPDYMISGSTKFKIITDHLGSPVLVVNATSGIIAQEIRYDEFGNILSDTNPGFQPFGFAGCLYDQDTKLCRFGARDYDASIGRWLSKDPILFNGGDTNLYGYVMQDPINFIDPEGTTSTAIGFDDWKRAYDNVKNAKKWMENIRKWAFCKINPGKCGADPAEDPFDTDPDPQDPKNPNGLHSPSGLKFPFPSNPSGSNGSRGCSL